MFGDYVLEKTSAAYDNKILLLDDEGLDAATGYSAAFAAQGFEVVRYKDDLSFRIEYEDKLKASGGKIVVMADSGSYIPYDVHRRLRGYAISMGKLFPKLNEDYLREHPELDMELLTQAYKENFDDLRERHKTEEFIKAKVYGRDNVLRYVHRLKEHILQLAADAKTYKDWFAISEEKAKIDVLSTQHHLRVVTAETNRAFRDWVLGNFGKLSTELSNSTPVLVSRAMEYMHSHSEKFVVIVMDGMSQFDWQIISRSFAGIPYEKTNIMAMIPSTTSVSRQCLLADKYPSQLMEPWKQSKEKAEFIACAKDMGFSDSQIGYERGYEATFGSFVRCGAVIINDVDDMVHAQQQGRLGMYNDIGVMADEGKLARMVKRFVAEGFDVYITADHGNTPCTGLGKLVGTGLEVETKSRRMLVLQDFANKAALLDKYGLIEYPKYYLKKDFDCLICEVGDSFDAKGEQVMTHGGISIDEVVVPFIKIKAGKHHG
ncbi:MAG: PglZ domain-containing protein [Bacteroidales bacterium]|nr:PglZ domain-containing protein [Bacteroidales bacterium]